MARQKSEKKADVSHERDCIPILHEQNAIFLDGLKNKKIAIFSSINF